MISVVIPVLNAGHCLAATLSALVPAAVDGIVREVIVVDGGSEDETVAIAEHAGADVISSTPGRGTQLNLGAARARFPWLLFLHADTMLDEAWLVHASRFMREVDLGERQPAAAVFRFRLDDRGAKPRALERVVGVRCAVFALPYGDQGLLIPRRLFDEIGGYKNIPIMEDVDIARRLGRKRLAYLKADAITSAARYQQDGYLARVMRNQACLALYGAGLPAERIARIYMRLKPKS